MYKRQVDIEVADIHLGKSVHAGKTIAQLHAEVGFGVYFKALFRQGHQQPLLPQTKVEVGDVIRIAGSKWCVENTASQLNSIAIVESTVTETFYLALSLLVGYFRPLQRHVSRNSICAWNLSWMHVNWHRIFLSSNTKSCLWRADE